MNNALKRLGTYRALNAGTVQFNSVIFRVVVGFLAGIPGHIIALIPAIEFIVNFVLEIPTGRLADKYGRIPSAIVGHISVILGLTACYFAILLYQSNPQASYVLFVIDGMLIGLYKPLTSGSIEAFYQDAIERSNQSLNIDEVNKSMTLSKKYGKHLTTIFIFLSFFMLYLFNISIGIEHSFIVGILLWVLTLYKLIRDYKVLGDIKGEPTEVNKVIQGIFNSKKSLISIFYSTSSFSLIGIVMGYFIVSVGREFQGNLKWPVIVLFMLSSQGFGWITKSYILPSLINKISEKNYLTVFYLSLSFIGFLLSPFISSNNSLILFTGIIVLGITFMTSVSAISSVAQNMILSESKKDDYAFVISLQSMPGYLAISLISSIFAFYFDGTPSPQVLVITMALLSILFLLIHLIIYRTKQEAFA